jgi:hypothetical protein
MYFVARLANIYAYNKKALSSPPLVYDGLLDFSKLAHK